MSRNPLFETAQSALALARAKGAQEASVELYRAREVETVWRDGKLEKTQESTSRNLGLTLYVDGRYAAVYTCDLRPEALARFIEDSVAMTRVLAKDPFRSLPDPKLCQGLPSLDLRLADPAFGDLTAERRRAVVKDVEAGARAVQGADRILSVTASLSDVQVESLRLHSNGFAGERLETRFQVSAGVSARDADGRRPEDYAYGSARFLAELPAAAGLGQEASQRTLARLGAKKGDSARMAMAVENRVAGRLLSFLLGPLRGSALQQKQSFLEGKLGQAVGSPLLDLTDDPLIPRALGSRPFDREGMTSRSRRIFEGGVLRNFYIDTYYGKKLGMAPTSGSPSNLVWKLGNRDRAALLADLKDGFLVTGFLGGNSNATTGDFSLGVQGFRIRSGALAEPLGEMNIAGNHGTFWKQLSALGNDPILHSSLRTPTLVFDGVQFAGT